MNTKKIALVCGVILLIGTGCFLIWQKTSAPIAQECTLEAKICSDGSTIARTGPKCEFAACPKEDLITIETPQAGTAVASPLIIKGKARGYWFFEASFPVKLYDANNNLLTEGIATATDDWMTEDFVPFEVSLNFTVATQQTATLVLQKDNPSDLPENADELKVPILLVP